MAVTLYVGNLPWTVAEDELAEAFGTMGQVQAARVIADRESGRSQGFGFVELEGVELEAAIQAMNGFQLRGRRLTVGAARPRRKRH